MTAFDVIQRNLLADIAAFTGPQASAMLAGFAAQVRDKAIGEYYPSSVATWVDGVAEAPLTDVEPTGVIRFELAYLLDVCQFIWETLRAKSPYRDKAPRANVPTHYRDEHKLLIDESEVDGMPDQIADGAEVVFVNVQPYARRIEHGLSLQAPNGVYEAVAKLARRRFGNSAMVEFIYHRMIGAGPSTKQSVRSHAAKARNDDLFPAIRVKARSWS